MKPHFEFQTSVKKPIIFSPKRAIADVYNSRWLYLLYPL